MQQRETICALATPPGVAGLAVIRISGSGAIETTNVHYQAAKPLSHSMDHSIQYGWWHVDGKKVDAVTATVFKAPRSYTGEDVVEIGCHGGQFVVDQILESLTSGDVRIAEPGEFTRRAFLNGKLDLTQVEAVADLIHAQSTPGAQTAARQLSGGFTKRLVELRDKLLSASGLLEVELDFSEEGYEFLSRNAFVEALREGISFASRLAESARSAEVLRSGFFCSVVGFPNAGKSSLFNALLDRPRAIVSHLPGTTRDYLEESLILDGYTVHLYDTAGLRDTLDTVEMQGIVLTSSLLKQSDLIMVVNDATLGFDYSDQLAKDLEKQNSDAPVLIIQNKMDIVDELVPPVRARDIPCSTRSGDGLWSVNAALLEQVKVSGSALNDVLVNARHSSLLVSLVDHLKSALVALGAHEPADLIAIDVRAAVRILGEITGETWNPDVLEKVFSQFCIGK